MKNSFLLLISGAFSSSIISRYFAKESWPVPKIWLAIVNISWGALVRLYGVYLSFPIANKSGWTPDSSTAFTALRPGISFSTALPVIWCISFPNWESSWGGLPTTVNGKIAFFLA